ncbi:MAG: LamG-like jellyroll fold domain-containing protein, partial [Planctomycetota bacterium]
VPDVVEMTEGDANTVITAVGLTVGELSYEYSDSTAADLVISQNPVGGAAVPAGSSIDLVVSLGPDGMPEGNGLVAHWEFEEGEGSIAYDSAGDKDGIIYGAAWTAGVFGGALDFDGDMDRVEVPDDDSLNPSTEITISWWVYNRGGQPATIYKYASCPSEPASPGNSRAYGLSVYEAGLTMQIFSSVDTEDNLTSEDPVSLDEWHHVAGTFNAGAAALYLDGNPQISDTLTVSSIMNDVQPLIIGGCWEYCGTDSFQSRLNGKADDVRIYDRALTPEEIDEVYQEGAGPIAHWKFDEGEGDIAYDSAGDNDGTLVNVPAWTTGILDGALNFDGVDDYVRANDDPSLDGMSALTLTAWVRTDGSGSDVALVHKYLHGTGGSWDSSFFLSLTSEGAVVFSYSLGGTHVLKRSAASVDNNLWHHIVAVYTGSEGSIFIDGQEAPLSRDDPDPGGAINDSDEDLLVGSANSAGVLGYFFEGTADDVRIYDRGLSAGEIEQLYQEDSGPVAHWKFDEGAGSIAYDSAGDNDGTVYGADWTTGILDGALSFDGEDDYVNVGQPESLTNMGSGSVALWLKPDSTIDDTLGTWRALFEKNGAGATYDGDMYLAFTPWVDHPGVILLHICNDAGENFAVWSDDDYWPGGVWQHVAVSWDNATGAVRMFINGEPETEAVDNFAGVTMSVDRDVTIGRNSEMDAYWWDGKIDDVRVYNRALSAGEVEQLYEEGTGPGPEPAAVFHVDGINGSDLNDGLTLETAFATIQRGIDEANDSNTVLVYPAVYQEEINFDGKAITVQGVATEAGVPVIDASPPLDYAVSMWLGEGPNSVLSHFVIRNCELAVFLAGSAPTLTHLTIVDNEFGIGAYVGAIPDISNCIFYNNADGDLFDCEARHSWVQEDVNEANEPDTPMFADAAGGDYHLKSERGRYWPAHGVWVLDDVSSPCIDIGDPNVYPLDERMPNGGRINAGAYGNTPYASMSEWPIPEDNNRDGVVNWVDVAMLADRWLEKLGWAE